MNRAFNLITALLLCGYLAACGTDSSSSDQTGNIAMGGGPSFSLRVTDAPIDDAVSVVLRFTEVKLRNTNGNWTTHTFSTPKSIDLLQLQGTLTADLVVNMAATVGDYDEIRLLVDSTPMVNFIDLGVGGVVELTIPSGSSSGLKIKGDFSVLDNRATSLVMDLDLRQSITVAGNSGKYILNPVVRLVNDSDVGHIRGMVASALLTATSCSDGLVDTFNAVYVYAGHNVTPDDIDQSSTQNIEPMATSSINYDVASMRYIYEAAFLPAGDYTVALTCNADDEELDQDDDLDFFDIQNVTVVVNNTIFL